MQRWRDASLTTKVILSFAMVFVATVGLGLFGLSQTSAVNSKAADIRDNWLPSTAALGQLISAVRESRVREARVVISAETSDQADLANDVSMFQTAQSAVDQAYAKYQPLITAGTDDERLMRTYADAWTKLKASGAQVADLANRHDLAAMSRLYRGEDRANFDAAAGAVVADLDFNAAQGKSAAQESEATYVAARLWTIAALVLCGLLCVTTGLAIARSVAGPLRLITAAVERLATGDLDVAVSGADRADEIGMLARGLDVFKRNAIEARELASDKATAQTNRGTPVSPARQPLARFRGEGDQPRQFARRRRDRTGGHGALDGQHGATHQSAGQRGRQRRGGGQHRRANGGIGRR